MSAHLLKLHQQLNALVLPHPMSSIQRLPFRIFWFVLLTASEIFYQTHIHIITSVLNRDKSVFLSFFFLQTTSHQEINNTEKKKSKARFSWNSKIMFCIWLMIISRNIGGSVRLSWIMQTTHYLKHFCGTKSPRDLMELLVDALYQSVLCRRWCSHLL